LNTVMNGPNIPCPMGRARDKPVERAPGPSRASCYDGAPSRPNRKEGLFFMAHPLIPAPTQGSQRETLDDLSLAVQYNRWIYRIIRPFLGLRILEIGCGTGNITHYLTDHGHVCAADVNDHYLEEARKNLRGARNVQYRHINLEKNLRSLKSFLPDTIVCVNVLEHVENDRQTLQECLRLLPGGGHLLVFVPALQSIYGTMDESYGHFRRYSKGELNAKTQEAGFKNVECRYMNLPGIPGWWLNGKVLRRKIIPKGQMLLYDKLVPLIQKAETILPPPIGMSIFSASYKPAVPRR